MNPTIEKLNKKFTINDEADIMGTQKPSGYFSNHKEVFV
jgi:hypothetical protein